LDIPRGFGLRQPRPLCVSNIALENAETLAQSKTLSHYSSRQNDHVVKTSGSIATVLIEML
jgi:hypothetical protein